MTDLKVPNSSSISLSCFVTFSFFTTSVPRFIASYAILTYIAERTNEVVDKLTNPEHPSIIPSAVTRIPNKIGNLLSLITFHSSRFYKAVINYLFSTTTFTFFMNFSYSLRS